MTDIDPGLLGTLTDVSGASFVARLHMVGERFDGYRQVGVERVAIGQVGRQDQRPVAQLRGELVELLAARAVKADGRAGCMERASDGLANSSRRPGYERLAAGQVKHCTVLIWYG